MFYYKVYGKIIYTNVEMPLLLKISRPCIHDLRVIVSYDYISGKEVYIKEHENQYDIKLGTLAIYRISPDMDTITCVATNFESFFSTLFNIPFSVYFLNKNEILYHACSLVHNGNVICLTGNKGIGKSTLMSMLSETEFFEAFSDDTVYIDYEGYGHRAHELSKLTLETVDFLKMGTLKEKNIAGKFYNNIECHVETAKIHTIIQIVRTHRSSFELVKVNNILRVLNIFKSNIVGASYMPPILMNKVLKTKPNPKISFYELRIPNQLEYLIKCKRDLAENLVREIERLN